MISIKRNLDEEIRAWKKCLEGLQVRHDDFPFLRNDLHLFREMVTRVEGEHRLAETLREELDKKSITIADLRNVCRVKYDFLLNNARAAFGSNSKKMKEFVY